MSPLSIVCALGFPAHAKKCCQPLFCYWVDNWERICYTGIRKWGDIVLEDQILDLLLSGEEISGEEMAKRLSVSRSAVWKGIGRLRERGVSIAAQTNRGYRLLGGAPFSAERFYALASDLTLSYRLSAFDVLDSTNTYVKALAEKGEPGGLCVVAGRQTGGRGRCGKAFYSPAGGLYLSVLLREKIEMSASRRLTSSTAVAVSRAVDRLLERGGSGERCRIKWVNDIFLSGRKICGILCEAGMNFEAGELEYAVIGIGVNCGDAAFPDELSGIAGSILSCTGVCVEREALAAEILRELRGVADAARGGSWMAEYREKSLLIGRRIHVLGADGGYDATAESILDDGSLLVTEENGQQRILSSGEVSVRLQGMPAGRGKV